MAVPPLYTNSERAVRIDAPLLFPDFLPPNTPSPISGLAHANQYNVAVEIVLRLVSMGALVDTFDDLSRINKINAAVVGPVFIGLQGQTLDDLRALARHGTATAVHGEVQALNQASELGGWLKNVDDHPDWLHLLIHDEAHWGIANGSQINNQLEQLASKMEDLKEKGLKRHLVVVLVSATMAVLNRGIPSIKKEGANSSSRVIWDMKDPRFGAPHYRSVHDLKYEYDDKIGALSRDSTEGTMGASEAVLEEYVEAAGLVLDGKDGNTPAYRILKDLSGEEKVVAGVRLSSIEHAIDLERRLCAMKPKYTVRYVRSDRAKKKNQDALPSLHMLTESTLIIMVDMVRMGERVSDLCLHWDVRCRYRSLIETLSTFVQDVGRCAGHGKPIATVYTGIPQGSGTRVEQRFKHTTLDRLLTSHGTKKNHPEHEGTKKVYSKLLPWMVLLEAEPQMGKTGVILSLIHILDTAIVTAQHMEPPLPKEKFVPPPPLIGLTRQYYFRTQTDMMRLMSDQEHFGYYHDLMDNQNKAWSSDAPSHQCALAIRPFLARTKSARIVDAGCGRMNLLASLRQLITSPPRPLVLGKHAIRYFALDIPTEVQKIPTLDAVFNPTYIAGDYAVSIKTLATQRKATIDFVVFSLSLAWTHDAGDLRPLLTDVITLLKPEGQLIIADMPHRFSPELDSFIEDFGFELAQLKGHSASNQIEVRVYSVARPISTDRPLVLGPKYF